MLGYISALLGCCLWLMVATLLSLPISGTHSIVGSTIGMAIVSKGIHVVQWWEVLRIVISWFISPVVSGLVSAALFMFIRKFVLNARSPLEAGLALLPIIYTITIFINLGGILESAPPLLGLDLVPWWGKLIIIGVVSVVVYMTVWLIVAPFLREKITPTLPKSEEPRVSNGKDNESFDSSFSVDSSVLQEKDQAGLTSPVFEMTR